MIIRISKRTKRAIAEFICKYANFSAEQDNIDDVIGISGNLIVCNIKLDIFELLNKKLIALLSITDFQASRTKLFEDPKDDFGKALLIASSLEEIHDDVVLDEMILTLMNAACKQIDGDKVIKALIAHGFGLEGKSLRCELDYATVGYRFTMLREGDSERSVSDVGTLVHAWMAQSTE